MSSTPASDVLLSCSGCGATIYPEHLERHLAGYWSGTLYCSYCLLEKKNGSSPPAVPEELASFPLEEAASAAPASAPPVAAPASPSTASIPPAAASASPMTPPAAGPAHAPISAGVSVTRRPPRPDATGATRMRIFHAKLSDGAVAHLDQQINDWLDQNPEIEVKFANSTVGVWEGKHAEPNLILMLFY